MVTFPGVIRSGSEAKLCVSLLKPEENLQLTISLVYYKQKRTLLQERTEREFHLQDIQVEAQGKNTQMIERKKVRFMTYNPLTIIKTDKQFYNPGQTGIFALYSASLCSDPIQFRIFTVDLNFKPVDETYKLITVQANVISSQTHFSCINVPVTAILFVFNAFSYKQDNRMNRINQWINATSTHGKILQLSHTLNPEAHVGSYELLVETGKQTIKEHFQVKEYTHGHPVQGTVKMGLCKSIPFYASQYQTPLCVNRSAVLNETGCASEMFTMSVFIERSERYYWQQSLDFTASVTEEGTDISMEKTEKVILTYTIGRIKLINLPEFFENGSVIQAKVKAEFFNGSPFPYFKPQELTTDISGLARFTIDTSLTTSTSIYVSAQASSNNQFSTPFRFESAFKSLLIKSNEIPTKVSQLVIKAPEEPLKCEEEISVTVQYTIAGETIESGSVTIVYLVSSGEEIVHHGYKNINVKGSDGAVEGEVMFKVPVHAQMAPKMGFLTVCHPVSLQFSSTTAVPGEENTLRISAQPGSLCGLSAVDQSILILESGKRLDADKVFNMLPGRFFPYDTEYEEDCIDIRSTRSRRFLPPTFPYNPCGFNPYPSRIRGDAVYYRFRTLSLIFLYFYLDKDIGLKVVTNLFIRLPTCQSMAPPGKTCLPSPPGQPGVRGQPGPVGPMGPMGSEGLVGGAGDVGGTENAPLIPEETIRTFFPETWIWELVEVGDSGSAQVPVTVPDTITSWETEAFCLSSKGLGLAPPAQLTVFQPFFLELSLPYSIIRGEIFELKATVFNYLSKCIMVKVTPAPSSDYTLKASSDDQYLSCLCANGRKTFKWILTPSVLGVLNITVSAEAEASQTVCDNEIVSVPERGCIDTVTRSLRVNAEGVEKTNTHSWLLCPKGQNLLEDVDVLFPTNMIAGSGRATVSVLGDILGRALRNLDGLLQMPYGCGEQNIAVLSPNIYILQYLENTEQLTSVTRGRAIGFLKNGYQRQLNYENSDGSYTTFGNGEGNTWLTAFVLRTFGKAQRYIFIDPQKIQNSKQWLIRHQRADGSYESRGKLFNNSDDVTITAYITASLHELDTSVTDPALSKGLSYLKRFVGNNRNTYTTALLAYTFSLAKDKVTRDYLLKKLMDIGISEGSRLHWSQSGSADDFDSLAVEISSYVLLAVLTTDPVTPADLGFANRIVSWLVEQQNAYGGFSSTQDTVVALQALSFSDDSSTVTVQSAGDTHHFDVNQDNKLLYQEKQLQNVPAKYSIEVKGSTCVSVQMSLFYNIPTPRESKALQIFVRTGEVCQRMTGQILDVILDVMYTGTQDSSNMVIVDMKLLSGFKLEPSSLDAVQKTKVFRQTLRIKQIFSVKNLKPAVIKVYDYYQTRVEWDPAHPWKWEKLERIFMVTVPGVIRSGSEAKLCVSLLRPEESLQLTISLAPEANSVQEIQVEAQGENTYLIKKRKVKFLSYNPFTIIQTDKPIYNPGQTVQFRIFTVDLNFKPIDETTHSLCINVIAMLFVVNPFSYKQDSRRNRINQWINATSTHGKILQLSHTLNPEAPVVLPKFEVKLHKPNTVRANEEKIKLGVCVRYTHGHPVQGTVKMGLCKTMPFGLYYPYQTPLCMYFMPQSLEFTASVTEEGTDISMKRTENVFLNYTIGSIKFIDLPEFVEKGTVIQAKVKAEFSKGNPSPYFKVVVHHALSQPQELTTDINGLANFTIDTSLATTSSIYVLVRFSFAHGALTNQLGGPFNFRSAYKTLQIKSKESPAKASQLVIKALEEPLKCEEEISVTVQYTIAGETIESGSVTIVYLVLSREAIVHHGYKSIEVKGADGVIEGDVMFKVPVHAQMAPTMEFLAYCVLPSKIVLAASRTFQTEKCFENKVSLQFSPTTAVPGEENILQISAQPGSLCSLSAVDQSILIMESQKRLNADKVFNLLPVRLFPYEIEEQEDCIDIRSIISSMSFSSPPPPSPPYTPMQTHPYPSESKADAVYASFRNMGLTVVTNLIIKMPSCIKFRDVLYQRMFGGFMGFAYPPFHGGVPQTIPLLPDVAQLSLMDVSGGVGVVGAVGRVGPGVPMGPDAAGVSAAGISFTPPPTETIRTFFPETWIWELVEVGDSGSAHVPVTVPDTITSWETEAFCLSSKGLGLAPPAQLTVFQPFFLELSLPYSIIRGEIFELKATVFNYLSKCIMVKVTPAPSSDYTLKASSDDQYSSCLCANGRKTFKWILTPSVLGVLNITVSAEAEASQTVCDNEIVSVPERGRIDTVTQSLRAEGIEKTNTHSWLLCPKEQSLLEEVDLAFPKNMIEGSGRATVSVIGDILGRALRNLDGLLQMPYGCGEQNIAVLSPNIYILQYLENTEQLTSAIRERATGFLKNGYQRQLNYENSDGSYTTFGNGDRNTWLTAFVLRTFGKAQRYIFIDPQKIQNSKQWLIRHQRADGSYESRGKLFNNRMKGGVSDDVTITAYITASLLELNTSVTDPAVTRGLLYLKRFVGNIQNTYTTALLVYTFSLAGDMDTRQQFFKKLEDVAISDGSHLHWSQSASAGDSDSLAVEISSYVLLAVLTTDSVTPADLGFANRIVSWLVKQQNAYGGFSSTQDTVVALQALSLYATKVFSSDGSSTVTVQSAGDTHHFDVNQDNKLLYQEKQLQNFSAKYSIEVKGSTCVSVQMSLFYNIPTPKESKALRIIVRTGGVCQRRTEQILDIVLDVIYTGTQDSSNMVIVDMKLLSGFQLEPSSVDALKKSVHRVEFKDDHVIMYLQEVSGLKQNTLITVPKERCCRREQMSSHKFNI
ncbi:Pregnancy zone protein [Labeo rohita]|uniref:Pregnancy zone protein n=1 Tax=Labeo rohita TaxID=84645 RepID=A0ABQ8LZZ4_LABRO|nr:Pregnancy zone protein [Labeo rohita]